MDWRKLLQGLGKAVGATRARALGDTGSGDFSEQLRGVTLRQFTRGDLGGSTEKLLYLQADGQCMYREISQYDGGVVHGEPDYGTWWATGDFPVGTLTLSWPMGGTTDHQVEYRGGDTCRLDGEPTQIQ